MKSAQLRFWILAGLYAAWIAFLLVLALTTRNPVVLSRPQIMAATLDVRAQVDDPASRKAKVVEVLWPESEKGKLEGQEIVVDNLPQCVRSEREDATEKEREKKDPRTENERWTKPGEYLLPLEATGKGGYRVATPLPSPGFNPSAYKPHIYPWTEETQRQFEAMPKP
jgi:hypothetical protein